MISLMYRLGAPFARLPPVRGLAKPLWALSLRGEDSHSSQTNILRNSSDRVGSMALIDGSRRIGRFVHARFWARCSYDKSSLLQHPGLIRAERAHRVGHSTRWRKPVVRY